MIKKLISNNNNNNNIKRLYSTNINNSTIPQSLLNNNNNNIFKTIKNNTTNQNQNNNAPDINYILNQFKINNQDTEKNIIEYYQSFVDDYAKKETKLMNWDISHWSALKGHSEVLKNFIDFKKQQHQQQQAPQQQQQENSDGNQLVFKQDKFGVNSLHIAIQRGYNDLAELIIDSKECDLNQRDTKPGIRLSALHLAMNQANPSFSLIKKLLENGANVNQETTERRTVLFRATQLSRLDLVELLLKYNININNQDNPKTNGWEYYRVTTPLHTSVSKGDLHIVKILIENGGNPSLRLMDDCGESLLHIASLNGDIEMTKYLVGKGADINQVDCHDATPLDYAESGQNSNTQYIQFLLDTYPSIKRGKGRRFL